jgi:hypothetical protein
MISCSRFAYSNTLWAPLPGMTALLRTEVTMYTVQTSSR